MDIATRKVGRPRKAVLKRVVKKNVSINPENYKYIMKILEERKMEVKGHFSPIINEIIADHLKVRRYKDFEAIKLKERLHKLEGNEEEKS